MSLGLGSRYSKGLCGLVRLSSESGHDNSPNGFLFRFWASAATGIKQVSLEASRSSLRSQACDRKVEHLHCGTSKTPKNGERSLDCQEQLQGFRRDALGLGI